MEKKKFSKALGANIRYFREGHGITKAELGAMLGLRNKMPAMTIGDFETGTITPTHDEIKEMAEILNVSVNVLKGFVGQDV